MISLAVPKQLGSVKNAKHQESCTNIFSSPFSHVWRVIDFNATDDHNFQEGHILDMRCLFIYFLQKLLKQKFGLKKKSNIMCQVISSPPNIKSYVYNFKILNQLWEIVQISFLPATRKQTVYVSTTPIFQVTWFNYYWLLWPWALWLPQTPSLWNFHSHNCFKPTSQAPHLYRPSAWFQPTQRNFIWKTCNHLLLNTQQTLAS